MRRRFGFLILLATTLGAASASAADLKVTSAGAVRGLIAGMIEDYKRQTGQTFDFTIGTTGQLRAIIQSGFPADPRDYVRSVNGRA
jgi:ABC-type molybdate transport system substrate-binding protein